MIYHGLTLGSLGHFRFPATCFDPVALLITSSQLTHKIRNTPNLKCNSILWNTLKTLMMRIALRQTLPSECDSGTSVPTVSSNSRIMSASHWAAFLFVFLYYSFCILTMCWDEFIEESDIFPLWNQWYVFWCVNNLDLGNLMERKSESRWDEKQKKITERIRRKKWKSSSEKGDNEELVALNYRSGQQLAETTRVHMISIKK